MFRYDKFEIELRKDNSHYERFRRSSLHDLVELLKRKMPPATPAEVQREMAKVPPAKWTTRYKNVHRYLTQAFHLQAHAAATAAPVNIPGYTPGKWQQQKDRDGRWHNFVLQERGNSCGPACVAMVKRGVHRLAANQVSEQHIRGLVALADAGRLHEGVSALSSVARNAHDWVNVGSMNDGLIKVLHAQPHRVATARDAGGMTPAALLEELRTCTPNKPAIVGWLWGAGGGHWTCCVGPTADGADLVILDPWDGVQYVDNSDPGFMSYQGGDGTLDLADPVLV